MGLLQPGRTILIAKTALGAGVAWALATYVSANHYPYFAPLAVILTLQATVADTMRVALYRVAGIVGGVVVATAISYWFHMSALTVGLAILLGLIISALLRLNPAVTSQVGVTTLMVLVSRSSSHYALDRILESALGAVVGIVINAVIIPPNEVPRAEAGLHALTDHLAESLRSLAAGQTDVTRDVQQRTEDAARAMQSAEQSIKFNLLTLRRRGRVRYLAGVMRELERIAVQVRGIGRGMDDLQSAGAAQLPGVQGALTDTADCLAAFGRTVVSPSAEAGLALQGAVARAMANQTDCLRCLREIASPVALRDLGAVFSDLNRILTEVCAVLPPGPE